jgi:putative SOS response-associated peptidase YedK
MCGRVVQVSDPIRLSIVDGLVVRDSRLSNYPRRWNGAPSQELLVIRENHNTGERALDLLKWGLIPYWCSDPKEGRKPINAKSETVATLPTFRDAYRRRRCILPVDAFYEWKAMKGRKQSLHWHESALPERSGRAHMDRCGCCHAQAIMLPRDRARDRSCRLYRPAAW